MSDNRFDPGLRELARECLAAAFKDDGVFHALRDRLLPLLEAAEKCSSVGHSGKEALKRTLRKELSTWLRK